MSGSAKSPDSQYRARGQYVGEIASSYDADRQSSRYARWRWSSEIGRLEAAIREVGTPCTVLDVPTGTGRMVPALSSQSDVVGGDVSMDMLLLAEQLCRELSLTGTFVQCDAVRLPFRDQSFDVVASIRFFQHIPEDVVLESLVEFRRIARKGVLVQLPLTQPISRVVAFGANSVARLRGAKRARVGRLPGRMFPARRSELDRVAAMAGLEVAHEWPVTWFWSQLRLVLLRPSEPHRL